MDRSWESIVAGAVFGAVVGDALGVPAEFTHREALREHPIVDMVGGGVHGQPAGTWSDDSSMLLCLLESLCDGLSYDRNMEKYLRWANEAYMTPHGKVFDMGKTTRESIWRFAHGTPPLQCGAEAENENGNGSLMRIMPLALWLSRQFRDTGVCADLLEIAHTESSLTHAHPISRMCCGFFCAAVFELLRGNDRSCIQRGITHAAEYYRRSGYAAYMDRFERIVRDDFRDLPQSSIGSSGYVLDTLEASLWCFLNTNSYRDCVLSAVNLGSDTDTTGCVAGGLAGLWYGLDSIPQKWIDILAKSEMISQLCRRFAS